MYDNGHCEMYNMGELDIYVYIVNCWKNIILNIAFIINIREIYNPIV